MILRDNAFVEQVLPMSPITFSRERLSVWQQKAI
jgi:hypothetical protein